MKRILVLLLIAELGPLAAMAQNGAGSPYSAYGFGDLLATGQASQAMMAGTGLAITEPYSVIMGNPAGYPSLARPVFEIGTLFRTTRGSTAETSSTRKDARFMGFTVGVPFGAGKWGLAFGLTPFSDVDYTLVRNVEVEGDPVQYKYTGSGGLDRAFFGLGRNLYQQQADSVGNVGMRVSLGADFNFLFGNVGQTREAVYPRDAGYINTRAFSTLVLRGPAATASLIWRGDLTKKNNREDDNWRWSVGVSAGLPQELNAKYNQLVTTYTTASDLETQLDTVGTGTESQGTATLPLAIGIGLGVQNNHWAVAAELHQRQWTGATVDVPGYSAGAPMRDALSYAVSARFRPSNEGSAFLRAVYRVGIRQDLAPQLVHGQGLDGSVITGGVSLPLNAVQTNSWLHIGGEWGQRGTREDGLIQERHVALWVGLAFTPWRGERWFVPSKIQ